MMAHTYPHRAYTLKQQVYKFVTVCTYTSACLVPIPIITTPPSLGHPINPYLPTTTTRREKVILAKFERTKTGRKTPCGILSHRNSA